MASVDSKTNLLNIFKFFFPHMGKTQNTMGLPLKKINSIYGPKEMLFFFLLLLK